MSRAAPATRPLADARGDIVVAILAGGLGTRLGAIARDVPKPMIGVNGKPFLQYVIASFVERGMRDVVLLTGHLGDRIEQYFGDGSRFDAKIRYSREPEPAGTGGAVRLARPLLGDRFLLTYGDVCRRFDYDRFVTAHECCVAVYDGGGNVAIESGRVVRYDKRAVLPYMDAGFCVMPASVIDALDARGSFEETIFPRLTNARKLEAEIVNHDFVEIGTPEALAHAREVLR